MRRSLLPVAGILLITSVLVAGMYVDGKTRNSPPEITIPSETEHYWAQYERVTIKPDGSDPDPGEVLTYHINMEEELDGMESISDQLPFVIMTEGVDWVFNSETGEFWWYLDDQAIWKVADGFIDSVEVALVFGVRDSSDQWAYQLQYLVLADVNDPPDDPGPIHYRVLGGEIDTPGYTGMTVDFWVDEIEDPDGDNLTYRWDFGDGQTCAGREVHHDYSKEGYMTVQMWADDGEFDTDKSALRIEIIGPEEDVGDDDVEVSETSSSTSTAPLLINIFCAVCLVAAVIFILVILVIIVLISRFRNKR